MVEFNQRIIAPSILASDWSQMKTEVARAEQAGADWLHLDVMDGHFVDNISFGPQFVKMVRGCTEMPLDVHLMIVRPDHYLDRFIETGVQNITVHVEAEHDVSETLGRIRAAGITAGLAISPDTDITTVFSYLDQIDLMLVMTVRPGFGGQSFMEDQTMPMVDAVREERTRRGLSYHIEVDGGIDARTAHIAARHGANVIVAGTSLFGAENMAAAVLAQRGPEG